MKSTARQQPRISLAQLSQALLASVALIALPACSTVSAKMKPQLVTKEGIRSAKLLDAIVATPLATLDLFAKSSAQLLTKASHLEAKGQPIDAAGCYLKAAADARNLLASGTEIPNSEAEAALVQVHNQALARFAEIWSTDPRRQLPSPHRFECDGQTFEIALSPDSDFEADFFDRAVAADSIKGKGVVQKEREGYGAPLVAIREQRPERAEEMKFYPLKGLNMAVTLVMKEIRSVGSGDDERTVVWLSILDPQKHETIQLGKRRVTLAANFSAPMELLLTGRNEALWGLEGFFEADKRIDNSGIFLVEPYDPKRIPVILTHGLISVPIIWRDLVPELISEPDISKRYQIMVFTYPSSYSIVESAHLFRTELADLRATYDPDGNDPLSTNMVAMGHSMGGVLTHMLVAEFGDNLWNEISDTPIDELPLTDEQKAKARELTYFPPDPAVRRVVYMSAPHRGAKMATSSLPGMISNLATLPVDILADTQALLEPDLVPHLKVDLSKKVTSVQSLRPDSPVSLALDESPYKKGVIYHSIIGDRGKGDTPNSSDGVVEYWSSHQDGAASELIVPTGHGSYTHPKAVADVKRILRVHAGLE
ncbi:MAG: hypothetical protein KDN19_14120 [Verrucomicrobiae bacterium]|nr:hypothetical protein [Verrucomicrobiae bacterium]